MFVLLLPLPALVTVMLNVLFAELDLLLLLHYILLDMFPWERTVNLRTEFLHVSPEFQHVYFNMYGIL